MPGAEGGAALLAALERGPLARCALLPLPAQGGFLAAYAGAAPAVASCCTSCLTCNVLKWSSHLFKPCAIHHLSDLSLKYVVGKSSHSVRPLVPTGNFQGYTHGMHGAA